VRLKIESGLPIQIVAVKLEESGMKLPHIYSLLKAAAGGHYRKCDVCNYLYSDSFYTCQNCENDIALSETDHFTEEDCATCHDIVLSNEG
jgi:hypothetical protein